jgi:hypothetical protein
MGFEAPRHTVVACLLTIDHALAAGARTCVLIVGHILGEELICPAVVLLPLVEAAPFIGVAPQLIGALRTRATGVCGAHARALAAAAAALGSGTCEAKGVLALRAVKVLSIALAPCEEIVAARMRAAPEVGAIGHQRLLRPRVRESRRQIALTIAHQRVEDGGCLKRLAATLMWAPHVLLAQIRVDEPDEAL